MLGELPILCAVVFLAPSLHALDDEVIDGMEIRLTGMIGSPQEAPKIPQFKESLTPLLVDPAGLAPGQYLAGIMATIGTDTSS